MKTPIRPGPHIEYKATLADGDDLLRAGLEATPANPGQRACSVVVDNTWVMRPLNDAWTAAYRLVIQDGAFVVGELRIYPTEPLGYSPGDWSGIWRGMDATVPDGGLTATLAREGAKMKPSLTASRGILRSLKKRYPEFTDLQEHGLTTFEAPKLANPPEGTLGRSQKFFQDVARIYNRAVGSESEDSQHPNQVIAQELKLDITQARDAVYRARKMGFIPKTTRGRMRPK